ncbi:hypothetical protein HOV30_gp070 [Erwinia phage Derbicus]|uniref:Uncharacterized protein n=2 Tax=Derbicusvirus derbicus TaxID=2734104 RepID=A0A482IHT2_9CAUD|nr:hypothetical protein BIZ82_gp070 [Erwinia phage vB_EamM_EarlPhillipIV]YP_009821114.1 hypothetical protein HOV30_gp070 [Erwinia phage Derbicus]ANZ48920.1 hypothetical protein EARLPHILLIPIV_70 [Erwinia phage vB_EamM_EarlPhillipIV]QBP07496.1 hypothetical protein DERBICUS_70 [Erwinia phage Derbicus]QXO09791.1 hypothetical protein pEaSNUABM38_00069 [Erwinia phage pEa_SNUABM_38]
MTVDFGRQNKIPVINAKGVAAHPYAPLEVGMLVHQRSRGLMSQPEENRKAAFVFNWERAFFFIHLEEDMIDWVNHSPWLTKPILMFQMSAPDFGQPLFYNAMPGVPIQHTIRRCEGYAGMVYTLEDFGDIQANFRESLTMSRANFLNKLKENIPDFQFPSENYVSPTTWRESSHHIVDIDGYVVSITHRGKP